MRKSSLVDSERPRRRWGATHDQLVACLSAEALAELIAAFGGKVIRVPARIHETRSARTDRIIALLKDRTYTEAAAEVGCARSTVIAEAKRSTGNT